MKNSNSSILSRLLVQMEILKQQKKKKKWIFISLFILLPSSLLILTSVLANNNLNLRPRNNISPPTEKPSFVESKLSILPTSTKPVPRLAYLISGSSGDGESMKRVVKALYHPLNQYVLHLDLEASLSERLSLVKFVEDEDVFSEIGNVEVVVRANLITYRGPTMVSNTLHAAAILMKKDVEWDWFINLSASDYPLVTQDDLVHTLAAMPRNLNFLEHTSDIGWKEAQRARPVIIDPGLYSLRKSDVFWVSEKRSLPTAFKLFTGSAWIMLSRPFMEYCLWGWDNLPRTILMYYANFLSSPEGYFHTVICNTEEFRNTTVNHDLHFISWDNPPKQHPHFLTMDDYQRMISSNAPFARKFGHNEPVLDKIDSEILGRAPDGFVPGGWFNNKDNNTNTSTPHYDVSDATKLKPGPGAKRLQRLILGLLSAEDFHKKQCT
ncbi:hypothetical protein C5167_012629 [Papaver somniferum]|uniref:Uncharacterized protein n=1 Tax=Papaver somniferum TaxID=3469 RepID=A0A4Y7IXZ3_PAPSO|nr:beta-glucuronosyltransferase GlcAT14B-like [Papaver somniferum]RZC53764.1 hypothetical protein C5167_012629 [Papaver somniferum]